MKVFISYKFTGEDPANLKEQIKMICDSVKKAGHNYYCSFWNSDFFKKNKLTNKQIWEFALKELETSDIYLAFIKSEEKSEGMLLEAGYALAKSKKIVLAIKKGVKTMFMREIANVVAEFETLLELIQALNTSKY